MDVSLRSSAPDAADFQLNPWRARFADASLETAFQRELMQKQWHLISAVALFIFAIDATSFVIDWLRQNPEWGAAPVIGARALAMVAGLLLVGVSKSSHERPWYGLAVEAYAVVILSITFWMLFQHGDYGLIAPVTLVCVVFALYLLMPFPWWRQTAYAALSSVVGVWVLMRQAHAVVDLARLLQWLVFAHAVGLLISWQQHVNQRRLYAQRIDMTWRNAVETQARVHHQALVDLLTHELRNPLASITTQAELIQRLGDSKSRHHALEVLEAGGRIRQMLEAWVEGDKLASARVSSDGKRLVLTEAEQLLLLDEALTRVQSTHPQVQVQLAQRFGLRPVRCDARTYSLVLLNLLDNAAKYGARTAGAQTSICVSLRHASGRVWVRVRDWGQGIAFDRQADVFEKHQRLGLDGDSAGLGVGLYLCRSLLSLHDGRLWLQSKPGVGAAFVMDLAVD